MHRPTVAVLTLLLIVGAAVMWIWPPDAQSATLESLHGAFVRMSILMSTLWLAEPVLRRYPPWMILVVLVGGVVALVAMRQPGVLRVAIPVLFILWMTRRTPPPKPRKSANLPA
ncbi:MAG: hypothetical protein WD875_07845 [Pirellulales bacterium]